MHAMYTKGFMVAEACDQYDNKVIHLLALVLSTSLRISVRAQGKVTLGTGVQIPVADVAFNYAAIHFPVLYNLPQRPVPLIPCLDGVGG